MMHTMSHVVQGAHAADEEGWWAEGRRSAKVQWRKGGSPFSTTRHHLDSIICFGDARSGLFCTINFTVFSHQDAEASENAIGPHHHSHHHSSHRNGHHDHNSVPILTVCVDRSSVSFVCADRSFLSIARLCRSFVCARSDPTDSTWADQDDHTKTTDQDDAVNTSFRVCPHTNPKLASNT